MLDKITAFCAFAFIACLTVGFVLFIFELVNDHNPDDFYE